MILFKQLIILFFTSIASFQDIKEREVSDILNYSFLFFSLLLIIYLQEYTSIFYASLVFLIGYLLYRKGIIGGGDVKLLTATSLLLPFYNQRFLILDIVFLAILLTSLALSPNLIKYLRKKKIKAIKENKTNLFSSSIFFLALVFIFLTLSLPLTPTNILLSLLVLLAIIYSGFEKGVRKMFYLKEISINQLQEDEIVETENLPKEFQNNFLTRKEFNQLKKLGYKKLKVYRNLPPLVPFIFIAEVIIFGIQFL